MGPRARTSSESAYTHWLIKAEPDSRIEKGVDVKFSIDDFEKCKISSWEGVRNHQAKNFLKNDMKLGHLCLFYASNCKQPGVTGIAKVIKEGYPDHNAWDPKHPYYDPRSRADSPTWFMVDVEFVARLPHLVPLALLQHLATLSTPPPCLASYLNPNHLSAISTSALVSRGRLSVQPASDDFFEACQLLGQKGGFDEVLQEIKQGKTKSKNKSKAQNRDDGEEITKGENCGEDDAKPSSKKRKVREEREEQEDKDVQPTMSARKTKSSTGRKAVKTKSVPQKEAEEDESEEEKMPTRGSRSRGGKNE